MYKLIVWDGTHYLLTPDVETDMACLITCEEYYSRGVDTVLVLSTEEWNEIVKD